MGCRNLNTFLDLFRFCQVNSALKLQFDELLSYCVSDIDF